MIRTLKIYILPAIMIILASASIWVYIGLVIPSHAEPPGRTTCILEGSRYCTVDLFKVEGHDRVCALWHNGYGSDMECWETTSD